MVRINRPLRAELPPPQADSEHTWQSELVDTFQRPHSYLRVSVTDRCNLRCRYCMPDGHDVVSAKKEILSFEEIIRVTRVLSKMGVRKVRLTGGEPLVRKDLPFLIEQLSCLDDIETVGLTTNGVLLTRYIRDLKAAGLHALNISLDTLRQDRFSTIAQDDSFVAVMDGIASALECDFLPLKINVVVMKGVNDDEILDFVRLTEKDKINVRFIEYMPFGSNGWSVAGYMPYGEIRAVIEEAYPLLPAPPDGKHAVSRNFRIPHFKGGVSFITSMSEHFCGTCNRIRLTADGRIKSCLFSHAETDVLQLLRNAGEDDEIGRAVQTALASKWFAHPPLHALQSPMNRSMVQIGG